MALPQITNPDWRQFERLVARIEADAGPLGLVVTSPDRIPCKITGRLREVDASVRTKIGTTTILVTIECRKRRPKQDVTWIEQLATKRMHLGAARTIAVSSSGFSAEAEAMARHHMIDLRQLSDVSAAEINKLMRLDFVLFTHKRCALARVAIRFFRSLDWTMPSPDQLDLILPQDTDTQKPLFKNLETGTSWSLNDLWLQWQDTADPFAGIEKGSKPEIKTVCFPYPGSVTVETIEGPKRIGDVLLSVLLALEVEQVDFESAKRIEYASVNGDTIQRIEFASREPGMEDWRVSLQMPKNANSLEQLRTRLDQPNCQSTKRGDHLKSGRIG